MKKFGGLFVLAVFVLGAVFALAFFPRVEDNSLVLSSQEGGLAPVPDFALPLNTSLTGNLGMVTELSFPGNLNNFRMVDISRGIYIRRDNVREFSPHDIFLGTVNVDRTRSPFNVIDNFRYETLKWDNLTNDWVITNWFQVFEVVGTNPGVQYELRKILPAGLYGIRAIGLNADGSPSYSWNEGENAHEFHETVFHILYADSLRQLTITDSFGGTVHNTRSRNTLGKEIHINVRTNGGAMDILQWTPDASKNGFSFGNLYFRTNGVRHSMISLYDQDIQISVASSGGTLATDTFPRYIVDDNTLAVVIPSNLSASRVTVSVRHAANNQAVGIFVIDNGGGNVLFAPSDLSGLGLAFVIMGTLVLMGVLGLFLTPRFIVMRQNAKYNKMSNERYMAGEGAKNDRHTKAQKANDAMKAAKDAAKEGMEEGKPTKGRSFLENMRENRAKRELAREAGLTMEEFRELEAEQKKIENAKTGSLSAFRQAMEEKKNIPVAEREVIQRKEGESEFELLDSLAGSSATASEDILKEAIRPNVDASSGILDELKQVTGESDNKKDEDGGSILSRIRGFTDE